MVRSLNRKTTMSSAAVARDNSMRLRAYSGGQAAASSSAPLNIRLSTEMHSRSAASSPLRTSGFRPIYVGVGALPSLLENDASSASLPSTPRQLAKLGYDSCSSDDEECVVAFPPKLVKLLGETSQSQRRHSIGGMTHENIANAAALACRSPRVGFSAVFDANELSFVLHRRSSSSSVRRDTIGGGESGSESSSGGGPVLRRALSTSRRTRMANRPHTMIFYNDECLGMGASTQFLVPDAYISYNMRQYLKQAGRATAKREILEMCTCDPKGCTKHVSPDMAAKFVATCMFDAQPLGYHKHQRQLLECYYAEVDRKELGAWQEYAVSMEAMQNNVAMHNVSHVYTIVRFA